VGRKNKPVPIRRSKSIAGERGQTLELPARRRNGFDYFPRDPSRLSNTELSGARPSQQLKGRNPFEQRYCASAPTYTLGAFLHHLKYLLLNYFIATSSV
jgi:hypothetical protein